MYFYLINNCIGVGKKSPTNSPHKFSRIDSSRILKEFVASSKNADENTTEAEAFLSPVRATPPDQWESIHSQFRHHNSSPTCQNSSNNTLGTINSKSSYGIATMNSSPSFKSMKPFGNSSIGSPASVHVQSQAKSDTTENTYIRTLYGPYLHKSNSFWHSAHVNSPQKDSYLNSYAIDSSDTLSFLSAGSSGNLYDSANEKEISPLPRNKRVSYDLSDYTMFSKTERTEECRKIFGNQIQPLTSDRLLLHEKPAMNRYDKLSGGERVLALHKTFSHLQHNTSVSGRCV